MPVKAAQAHVLIGEINSSPTWLSLLLSSWPPGFQPHRSCRKMQMDQSSRSITGIRGDRAVSGVPHWLPLGLFPQRIIITVPSSTPAKDPSPFRAQKLFLLSCSLSYLPLLVRTKHCDRAWILSGSKRIRRCYSKTWFGGPVRVENALARVLLKDLLTC